MAPKPEYFIGAIGDKGRNAAVRLVYDLRRAGITAEGDLLGRSVKAQLKYADKTGAKYSVIIGDDEIINDSVKVRNMESGESETVALSKFINTAREI